MLNQFVVNRVRDLEDAVASASEAALDELEVRLLIVMSKIRAQRERHSQVREPRVSRPDAASPLPPTAG